MPIFPDTPIRLQVVGRVRAHDLGGVASIAVDADGVLVAPLDAELQASNVIRIPFDVVDGATSDDAAGGTLHLHLSAEERLVARGDPRVHELARDVLGRGRVMPELTRAVRALGARRGGAGQEEFFKPLLEAKRFAARDWRSALDAFDAGALGVALEHVLARIAAERESDHVPGRAAARRALEACLCDAAEPLLLALAPIALAAPAARNAPPAEALRAWRAWVRAVATMFERADGAWAEVQRVLDAHRPHATRSPTPSALERLRQYWTH